MERNLIDQVPRLPVEESRLTGSQVGTKVSPKG